MFSPSRKLWLFAIACLTALLVGCGGASGTDSDKSPLTVCDDFQQVLEDGSCGEPPPLPACPEGEIREGRGPCFEPDFIQPVYTPAEDEVVIYYNDREKAFDDVQLYTWQACGETWVDPSESWDDGPQPTSDPDSDTYPEDPIYGAYWVVKINDTGNCGNFIIRTSPGLTLDQTNDLKIDIKRSGGLYDRMYFVIKDPTGLRNSDPSALPICIDDICAEYAKPALSIGNVAAHWVDESTILWHENLANVELYASQSGSIAANDDGSVANGTLVAELAQTEMTEAQKTQYPHLSSYFAYTVDLPVERIKELLKQQLILVGEDLDEVHETTKKPLRYGTGLQTAELLDGLYTSGENDADEAELGVIYGDDGISVAVWAPTAQKVELSLFDDNLRLESTNEMSYDSVTGIWRYDGDSSLDRKFYRFRMTSYYPVEGEMLMLETTDPYSVSLAANGTHSQIVDLNDQDLKPDGWDSHEVPTVPVPEAISIYEGHVRDFSIRDTDTPEAHRGKYLAFTDEGTAPVEHLQALKDAGINHLHLLPTYDNSSINEIASEQVNLDSSVAELCRTVEPRNSAPVCNGAENNNATLLSVFESYSPFDESARELANAMAGYDAFNWGYDPQHYNAPDGSYATDPHGVTRIIEMRAMNMALHNMGLRVVMDVVYPHTASAGVTYANSVFDKVVPGYYYRNNVVTGVPITIGSNAGPDTATEHRMMAKFMIDSVVMWAEQYKVDGFRFDQSGLIPKDVLVNAWDAVKVVDPDNYFYGEAWTLNADGRVAVLATQQNLAGTGIGTFNDRLRNPLRELDLVAADGNENAIRAGLAGNLASFQLVNASGEKFDASNVGAYNLDPQEAVNYVTKHDEETLWDWMHHPDALPADSTLGDRVRIHSLVLSVPVLSQGVPFIHMGSDILRSKSMSQNSYNAGDWFNYVDFTKQTNNWNVGLPVEPRTGDNPESTITDQEIRQAINDTASTPTPAEILLTSDVFNEFLRISSGSALFSLTTAEQVMDRVGFHNIGETQQDNLIVMSIDDGVGTVAGTEGEARADLDPAYNAIVVIFNGTDAEVSQSVISASGFELHPVQASSADAVVRTAGFTEATGDELGGTFTVPAYTAAVFVKPQSGAQGEGLAATATSDYEPPEPYEGATVYLRGDMNGWGASEANVMAYQGGGIYSYTVDLAAQSYGFKVADASWDAINYGAETDGTVTLGTGKTLAYNGGNLSFTPSAAGTYRFDLNALDPTAPVLTVEDALDIWNGTAVYVRGSMNGWGTDAGSQFEYQGGGIYTVAIPLTSGTVNFKVGSDGWSPVDLTAPEGETDLQLGVPVSLTTRSGLGTDMTLNVSADGTYLFTVNAANPDAPTLTVEAQ